MKKVLVHSNYDVLNKNGNMLNGVGNVSVKDFLKQMWELKKQGLENYIDFLTSDQMGIEGADAFLFVDMPEIENSYLRKAIATGNPIYLLAWESGIINPRNGDPRLHSPFHTIFTHDDALVDNKKYIKLAYSFKFPEAIPKRYSGKKLCCLIVGNKASAHPLELYSHRLEAINWFEKNHPGEFDLYGQGWTKIIPPRNIVHKVINRSPIINKYFKPKHISYRGEVDDKMAVYEKYLFAICYENAKDLPGYISEKIFDCFFSGCVPIYWGASNISTYIPEDCFIDKRKFENYEELYNYLKQMKEDAYLNHLYAIEKFLQENKAGIFSIDYFSETLISHIR